MFEDIYGSEVPIYNLGTTYLPFICRFYSEYKIPKKIGCDSMVGSLIYVFTPIKK